MLTKELSNPLKSLVAGVGFEPQLFIGGITLRPSGYAYYLDK